MQITGLNGVVQIAAGYYHSLLLRNDTTIMAFGGNVARKTIF
jgi:alpha-tubulin suppressor-like RCC1 family protein